MSFQVCIPTYDHSHLLGRQSLRLVEEAAIEPERVWLVVASEAERERYAAALPAWEPRMFVAERGLQNARRLAHGFFAEGERVLWMDDDVRGLRRLGPRDRLVPTSVDEVAEEGFAFCENAGSYLWGVYPAANAFYMRPRVRSDLAYCIGCFYGTLIRHDEELHPRFGDPKEDYERTLRYWERDGVVVRLDHVCPLTAYYRPGPGGDRLGRTLARVERNIAAIEGRWPDLVRRGRTKRYGFPEIRLHDRQPAPATV